MRQRTADTVINEIPEEVQQVKRRFSIIGNSPALVNAIERAIRVAPVDLAVLVAGESGAGKEFFPKIIHSLGPRKHKKYIAVNCGAIPEGTIDSELFGHEKGSFTGAVGARKGYFEEANGGTVFLDEVAELPLTTQARLLRVLETGEFLKVGSSEVQTTDVRIVAATNVDLPQAVAEGKFREDLYYRLSTVIIHVPNLHDRGGDISLLARKFASDFSTKYMTAPITFSEEATRTMMLYRWPGNVRQLKNVVDQLALFEAGNEISRQRLLEILPSPPAADTTLAPCKGPDSERDMLWQAVFAMRGEIAALREELEQRRELRGELGGDVMTAAHLRAADVIRELPRATSLVRYEDAAVPSLASNLENSEREYVVAALRRSGGNRRKAAEELNISPRTLYRKIREYGLDGSAVDTTPTIESSKE